MRSLSNEKVPEDAQLLQRCLTDAYSILCPSAYLRTKGDAVVEGVWSVAAAILASVLYSSRCKEVGIDNQDKDN